MTTELLEAWRKNNPGKSYPGAEPMSKKDEALKRALENICAAKLCEINSMSSRHEMIRLMDAATTVLREALAEPVEWLTGCPECGMDGGCDCDSGTWNPPAQQEEKPTTREEILSMAREAGIHVYPEFEGAFERFFQSAYAAGAADENEACAQFFQDHWREEWKDLQIAEAIRARGETK